MALPVFICDDETRFLTYYQQIIKNAIMINEYDLELILATTDPQDILRYLDKNKITDSLFFLDIDLENKENGIDLARQIRDQNEFAQIVFLTSHPELALETLKRQIAPLNYLIKDDKSEKIQIEHILEQQNATMTINRRSNCRYLTFTLGFRKMKIDISGIYFIETSVVPHKLVLYGEGMMFEFYGRINDFERDYPELLRVHKSFLINPNQIINIDFRKRVINFPDEYSCTFPIIKTKLLKSMM
ncbi:LytR/AlgR family response regulator transcription factor [Lapidilactobacillus wuchangensis]|uniref:LytR/AlgR family response regulator transcription factor n=1 Tax=Lapidilactobacillus wuchangensis TaxID=2486001 RepID=UPI000F780308|nr:LytTR family transcriptional regulator DNA-binding domain-containing protein [Lapidilactobacillus wuchangensis]